MNITRSNYEIYFIDYLEGNLDTSAQAALDKFLQVNPDLKEELKSFKPVKLEAEKIQYKDKDKLKKNVSDLLFAEKNFNKTCIARLEGDLTPQQQKEFDEYLNKNPELKKQYKKFTKTKLKPFAVFYQNKSGLKKMRIIHDKRYRRIVTGIISMAASVILFFIFFVQPNINNNNTSEPQIAEAEVKVDLEKKKEKIPPKDEEKSKKEEKKDKTQIKNNKNTSDKKKSKTVNPVKKNKSSDVFRSDIMDNIIVENLPPEKVPVKTINDCSGQAIALLDIPAVSTNNKHRHSKQEYEEYLTLQEFLSKQVREKIIDKTKRVEQIDFWDVAQAGVRGISKITGKDMKLENEYDENGKLKIIAFNSENFSFSTSVRK